MTQSEVRPASIDVDTGERGSKAVVVSLAQREGDLLRLSFDDGERNSGTAHLTIIGFFTHHDFSAEVFRKVKFSKDDLAHIGLAVFCRLIALEDLDQDG